MLNFVSEPMEHGVETRSVLGMWGEGLGVWFVDKVDMFWMAAGWGRFTDPLFKWSHVWCCGTRGKSFVVSHHPVCFGSRVWQAYVYFTVTVNSATGPQRRFLWKILLPYAFAKSLWQEARKRKNNWMWWLERECSPIGSEIWVFGPQWVALFGGSLRGVPCWRKCVNANGSRL